MSQVNFNASEYKNVVVGNGYGPNKILDAELGWIDRVFIYSPEYDYDGEWISDGYYTFAQRPEDIEEYDKKVAAIEEQNFGGRVVRLSLQDMHERGACFEGCQYFAYKYLPELYERIKIYEGWKDVPSEVYVEVREIQYREDLSTWVNSNDFIMEGDEEPALFSLAEVWPN